MTATGCPKSSTSAAPSRIVPVLRRSASMYSVAPSGLLVSRARAWLSTIGSLSTYTTRDCGAARCATWWVLFAERSPVPMSRNCLTPASVTRKCTARARNARCARTASRMSG